MPDFDVQQIWRKAADAIALSVLPSWHTAADREMVLNLPTITDDHRARAALAVIVPEVTQQVRALTYASDDGSEYEHDHGPLEGHDECPACWAADIRKVLDELDARAEHGEA